MAVEERHASPANLLRRRHLDVLVLDLHDVGDVEGAVAGGGLVCQRLVVDVAGGGHDQHVAEAIVQEGQRTVPDLKRIEWTQNSNHVVKRLYRRRRSLNS